MEPNDLNKKILDEAGWIITVKRGKGYMDVIVTAPGIGKKGGKGNIPGEWRLYDLVAKPHKVKVAFKVEG